MNVIEKNRIPLLVYGALSLIMYFSDNSILKLAVISLIFYSAWLKKSCVPAFLYLSINVTLANNIPAIFLIGAIAPVFISEFNFKQKYERIVIIQLVVTVILSLISYTLGVNSKPNTMILYLLCIFMVTTISRNEYSILEINQYGCIAFYVVFVILVLQFLGNGLQLMYGRLSINDNIRELAHAIAFPVIMSANTLFTEKKLNKKDKIINVTVLGVGALILIATLSKGTIASTFVAISLLFLFSKNSVSKKIIYIIIAIVGITLILKYLTSFDIFRINRLTEENDGFNGRTAIWRLYFSEMFSSARTLFWGFGPGDIKRLGISHSYAHSLFFDILLSYGIIGFIWFMLIIITYGIKIVRSKQLCSISLFVFDMLLCSTHGTSTNLIFYILIAASVGLLNESEKNVENNQIQERCKC